MTMRLGIALASWLAALLALAGSAHASAVECQYPTVRINRGNDNAHDVFGTLAPRLAVIASREGCTLSFRSGIHNVIHGIRITRRPQNGTAGRAGRASVAYQPRAGFRGQDVFVIEVSGQVDGRPTTQTVEISVSMR